MFCSDYYKISKQYDLPPTIFSILNSFANTNKYDEQVEYDERVKIVDLAKEEHSKIFDFNYPLSSQINKDDFEIMILNKFLMRRIAYETVTAFKIQLNVKLNEIMPTYNKMFEAIADWNLFEDGETSARVMHDNNISKRDSTNNSTSDSTNNSINENKFSDTPQNQIDDVKNGSYVSEYTYNQSNINSMDTVDSTHNENSTDNRDVNEMIYKSVNNRIDVYNKFLEQKSNIYTMIFKDLESLFFGYVNF